MIPLFKVFMSNSASQSVSNVLNSGMITQASKVEEFETALKSYFNHPYILTLNSATSGLTLALRLLNLQPGDEVLSTALTCTATNFPILANNLNIKWVDVDVNTCNISIEDLENKISHNTKAIMLVHWAGIPNDLDKIHTIVKQKEIEFNTSIRIIEDCAHSFGAKYNDKFIGTHGNISVFSLQAIKHVTSGDGGLIFLPNEEEYERAKLLRWFGIDRNYRSKGDFRMEHDIKEWGYKFHMNDINASIGIENLKFANSIVNDHQYNANIYFKELSNLKYTQLLTINSNSLPAWWIFTIKVKDRDRFIEYAKFCGVTASQVHKRNDIHSCLSEFQSELPNLDILEKEYVSIPVGWWIKDKERDRIIECVKNWDFVCDLRVRNLKEIDYSTNYLELYKELNGVDLMNMTLETFKKKLTDEYYVIEYEKKIIVCGKLIVENKFYDSVGHIEDVITHLDFRRKKLGSIMVNYLVDKAKSSGCYKVVLSAREKNENFYKSLGFSSDNKEYKIYF